jgi:hypothetical protein
LGTLFAFYDFEFDFLAFLQGTKPFGLDIAVMDEDVRAVLLGDKPVPLGIAKPFDLASNPHEIEPSNPAACSPRSGKKKENDRKAFSSRNGSRALLPLASQKIL